MGSEMTGSGWTSPGSDLPPGWSPRQPPPYYAPGDARPPGGGQPGPFGPAPPWPPYAPPEPKPGIIPLRPLGLGEIIDGAVSYIRQNPRATLGLAAIVTSISTALQTVAALTMFSEISDRPAPGSADAQDLIGLFSGNPVTSAIGIVVGVFAQLVLTGMLTAVIGRAVLGRPTRIGDAWRDLRPRLLPLLGLAGTMMLLFFVLIAVVAVPVAVLSAVGAPIVLTATVGVLLGAATVVAAVWAYVGFALATPALVLERAGVIAALRRSWTLVWRSFWRTFGILLLTGIIAYIIALILQLPFAVPQQIMMMLVNPDPQSWTFKLAFVIGALGSIAAGTVVAPFSAGVPALLYVDQRIRREGLDIALHGATREHGTSQQETPSPWLMSIGVPRERPRQPPGPYRGPPSHPPPSGTQGW